MERQDWRQRLGERLSQWMDDPRAYWGLFLASIMETLLIPVPIETILVPWMVARPRRIWRLALVALLGNLAAACIGYGLGAWAMNQFGDQLIQLFGGQAAFDQFDQRFSNNGFLAVLSIAIIPVPFQIAMLVAGSTGYSFLLFLLASLLARSVRYFGLALLVHFVGDRAREIWRRHERVMKIVLAVVVVGYLLYKLVGWWTGSGA
ncbi:membrane protein YqaA with SNARE-associated domain [Kushneria sinocarnis]|uniref:Membrane protein YqaA with SNARE-associated domain n=1 Tax=Kushneria sinocarnis TaxID=595502 RepID=A0A420WW38_9GAMM|nr:VTT domain-containing protein [Kushneria sinocarnis]RKR03300.1 membrane protein YqaA with SNARE-associated domain [Kushneria sinocarnis]